MPPAQRGVFISHITEESPVALVLQRHLKSAFGEDFPVFVSTDRRSILPGQQWYDSIVQSLRNAQVVIVLLSAESSRRGWITFEAGFGVGAASLLVPVSLSRFTFSQLAYPLAGLQGRAIDEIGFIIDAIANKVGLTNETIDVDAYLRDIREAEAKLNYKSLLVEPLLVVGQELCFDITNIGNVDLELLMLQAQVPQAAMLQQTYATPELEQAGASRDGQPYAWLACYSPRGAYKGIVPVLRPIITPSMQTVRLRFLILIKGSLSPAELEMYVYFQIHAIGYSTQEEKRTLKDISEAHA